MIIRRIASALKRQDLSQVIIEIMIVVVGIFIGLQVADWNNDREERVTERAYLSRLHSEVMQNLSFNADNFEEFLLLENFKATAKYIDEVLDVFEGIDTETVLNDRHCMAIFASDIYNHQQSYLPTLTELIASGQLSIIENEDIKIALSEYTLSFNGLELQVTSLGNVRLELHAKYPLMFKFDRRMRNLVDTDQYSNHCDFDAMKENQSFNNDLIVNRAKQFYFILVLSKQQQALQNVHAVLDEELGISHGGASQ